LPSSSTAIVGQQRRGKKKYQAADPDRGTSVWPRWRAGLISAGFDLDELVLVEDKAL